MDKKPLKPVINYDSFELPFVQEALAGKDNVGDASGEYDKADHLKAMQKQIPAEYIFLGEIIFEIPHSPGLTWDIDDYYYLMRWTDSDYDWALFRITWEDNWGRYEWSADARINGERDSKKAARLMFKGLMDSCGIDLKDEELEEDYTPYREFLQAI